MLYYILLLFDVMPLYKKTEEPTVLKEFHTKKELEKGLSSY